MLLSVSGRFLVSGDSDLDAQTDVVMESLLNAEQIDSTISDSDVTAVLGRREVTVSVVVNSDDWHDGQQKGEDVIKAAIESANGRVLNPPAEDTDTRSFVVQAERAELLVSA